MIDVDKIRKDFPMFENKTKMQGHELVFLDNASTTFKPYVVSEAVNKYLTSETSNSHRGDYDLCFHADTMIDEARKTIAKFLNANSNEIVFTSGASMSLNMVAYGYGMKHIKKDDEIIISQSEHASNVLPWFRIAELTGAKIVYVPLDKEGRITPESVKSVISDKTKVISIAQVGNVLGFVVDMKSIAKIAHEHDVVVVCDGAQSVPHMQVDVKDLDIDFLCFSGHKMCGPTGVGVLYGKYELLDDMDPLLSGGGMNVKFEMCGDVKYLNPPSKFEAGTMNIEGIYGLKAAVEYIEKIGINNINEYEKSLRKYMIEKMKEVPDIIIYNEHADSGIVTFNLKNIFAQDLATYLNSKGIAVRSGQHCAKILNPFLGTVATCRASIYFYTTKDDIDRLVDALKNGGDFLDAYFA